LAPVEKCSNTTISSINYLGNYFTKENGVKMSILDLSHKKGVFTSMFNSIILNTEKRYDCAVSLVLLNHS